MRCTPEESVGFLVDEAKSFGTEAVAAGSKEVLAAEDASLVV